MKVTRNEYGFPMIEEEEEKKAKKEEVPVNDGGSNGKEIHRLKEVV